MCMYMCMCVCLYRVCLCRARGGVCWAGRACRMSNQAAVVCGHAVAFLSRRLSRACQRIPPHAHTHMCVHTYPHTPPRTRTWSASSKKSAGRAGSEPA